ncbi:MAG: rRNA pseudouridine synthase [Chlamydiae bacterium]|nr:rRNA pseudouridine synthase [Chlamydiota bacterium]MBI3266199.1 rRNA pseudouridine synthase [Chlamydiota bacterium]
MRHKKFYSKEKSRTPERRGGHGLARVLSKLGIVSRSEAGQWIRAGRVKVNHRVVRDPEHRTWVEEDVIEWDGKIARSQVKIYLVLNKPLDVITTAQDPEGRTTVYQFLPKLSVRVFPVGRLDANTTGLLFFTNDTELGEVLTNHEYGIPKTYEVKARGKLSEDQIKRLRSGVKLDKGAFTQPCQCHILKTNEASTWLEMTLKEGKNRQIRKMLEAVGSEVSKLRRVAIGNLEIGDLKVGETRQLTRREVDEYILRQNVVK